jgi:hypothetical protein
MGSGAVRVYHQLRILVNSSESSKKRDELIYFIDRVMVSSIFLFSKSLLGLSHIGLIFLAFLFQTLKSKFPFQSNEQLNQ